MDTMAGMAPVFEHGTTELKPTNGTIFYRVPLYPNSQSTAAKPHRTVHAKLMQAIKAAITDVNTDPH